MCGAVHIVAQIQNTGYFENNKIARFSSAFITIFFSHSHILHGEGSHMDYNFYIEHFV